MALTITKLIETIEDEAASSEVVLYIPLNGLGGLRNAIMAIKFTR